jgi:nucleoid-associated protein YgaU
VQKGDRYATIAERFLGSKARWKEIYEINKDIFPEPGQIRYGVRIRIPDSASLASAR